MDVRRLLDEEEAGWRALHATFGRIPVERFEEPTLTPEGWSPKDAMFHLGAWAADCTRVLEQIREGTFDRTVDDAYDIEAMNRSWFEASRAMEPREVHAVFEGSRQKMREGFATLPEVTPDAWEWFEESGPLHYAKHVQDLEAWLG
jgi:Mycothiol maleylpyruvate isomerase N-terminal domain